MPEPPAHTSREQTSRGQTSRGQTSSDESLLEAAGKGDRKAFGELVRRHHSWAWGVSYRFTGLESESEDIVQSAFIKLLKAACGYSRTGSFKTFFHVIITRLCLDHAKRKMPVYVESYQEMANAAPGIEDSLLEREQAMRVRTALDCLPPKQRMAIVLRYYEDLGYEEMALMMETSKKGVERLLARGRESLRKNLGAQADFFSS